MELPAWVDQVIADKPTAALVSYRTCGIDKRALFFTGARGARYIPWVSDGAGYVPSEQVLRTAINDQCNSETDVRAVLGL